MANIEYDGGRASAQASSGCLCFALFFALMACWSPYWMWNSAYLYVFGNFQGTVTTASGSTVFSALQGRVRCGWWSSCFITTQWNYFDDFNNTLCSGEFYELIGQFGFCTAEADVNNTVLLAQSDLVQIPPEITAIQALSISTAFVVFFALVIGCSAGAVENDSAAPIAAIAAALSFMAMVLSCAAFSVAASYEFYQKFSSSTGGWFLPYIVFGGEELCGSTGGCVTVSSQMPMVWGPAFGGMIAVFIITFFTTCSLCGTVKLIKDQESMDEEYKGFEGTPTEGNLPPTLS